MYEQRLTVASSTAEFYQRVLDAADELTANGTPITSRSVRAVVKSGSYSRILSMLKLREANLKPRDAVFSGELPPGLMTGKFRHLGTSSRGAKIWYVGFPYVRKEELKEVEIIRVIKKFTRETLENRDSEDTKYLQVFTEVVLQAIEDGLLCREKSISTRQLYQQEALHFLRSLKTDGRLRRFYTRHSVFEDGFLEKLYDAVHEFSVGGWYDNPTEIYTIGLHNAKFLAADGFFDSDPPSTEED